MCSMSFRARLAPRSTGRAMQTGNRMRTRRGRLVRAGFTMLELMVVIAIILVLLGLAVGRYERSILRSREVALKQDLVVMRQAIENYTLDKQTAPQSLDDLVSAQYLREIPTDPSRTHLPSLCHRVLAESNLPQAVPTSMNRPKEWERHHQLHYRRPGQAPMRVLRIFFGRKGKRSNGAAPADGGSAASAAGSNQRDEVEMARVRSSTAKGYA